MQKSPTKWTVGTNKNYKERITKLRKIQLSLYFGIQPIFIICDLIDGRYDRNIAHHISFNGNGRSIQRKSSETNMLKIIFLLELAKIFGQAAPSL